VLPEQYAMWVAPILSVPLHNNVRDFQQLLKLYVMTALPCIL